MSNENQIQPIFSLKSNTIYIGIVECFYKEITFNESMVLSKVESVDCDVIFTINCREIISIKIKALQS